MTSDYRITWGLVLDVLDVLEQHGYHRYDNQHTGLAVLLIGDLASAYTGRDTQPSQIPEPSLHADQAPDPTHRDPPRRGDHEADPEVGQ
jgi:hypothetical protein